MLSILSSTRAVPSLDWVLSWFFSRFRAPAPASPRTPFVPFSYWTSCRFTPCVPSGRLPDRRIPFGRAPYGRAPYGKAPYRLSARHPSRLSCGILSRWCSRIWRRIWGGWRRYKGKRSMRRQSRLFSGLWMRDV